MKTKKEKMLFASKMYMISGCCWILTSILSIGVKALFLSYFPIGCAMFCLSFAMKAKAEKMEEN